MVYKCFDKKSASSGVNNEIEQNQQLAKESHKPIVRKFKKRTVHSGFKYYLGCSFIWYANNQQV